MQITNNEHISSDNAPAKAAPFRLSVAFPWCQREFGERHSWYMYDVSSDMCRRFADGATVMYICVAHS